MLEIKDVTFSYAPAPIASNILCFDLTVKAHSITVIEGMSGIGKSTLLHLIAGFLTPLSGDILWQGQSICGLLPAERPVSMLFQNDNLFPHLDVWTNIAIGLAANIRNSTESREMMEQSLSDLGIQGMNKRLISTLSGGQQQRVALARALARSRISPSDQTPRRSLLLLDEPFSALDPETKAECLDQVKQMVARDGLTALMVTHDPADAKNLDAMVFSLKQNS
jgi:thiamine transport system ATP-binding protein